ncbi:MAG: CRISPR-associated helicase Cas3' [Candidatus Brocadiia bacterium]
MGPGDNLLQLWAKTDESKPPRTHPLLFHMLDTANVCLALWRESLHEQLKNRLTAGLSLEQSRAARWLAFFAGLHDIGKATPPFQVKLPPARKALERQGFEFPRNSSTLRHNVVSAKVLEEALCCAGGRPCLTKEDAMLVAQALGGHHGVFPTARKVLDVDHRQLGGDHWRDVREALIARLAKEVGVADGSTPDLDTRETSFPILLAALACLSDWIASDQDSFPCVGSAVPMEQYTDDSRDRADAALNRLGWTGWEPSGKAVSFADLFGEQPWPVQEFVEGKAEEWADKPGLVLIEAPTGGGKTEAAFLLADRWNGRLGQQGIYFALPTQATSNQMFRRARSFLADCYPSDVVNLHLLHGQAALMPDYHQLRAASVDGESDDAAVVARRWFCRPKRGLLAPFGVGTVDQSLLSVLQTRHYFLRLYGLACKTLIIDEVHAYDTYMSTLLDRLLAWCAAMGTSVILLSATLPAARRRQLVASFTGDTEEELERADYPRVTHARTGAVTTHSVPPHRRREILLDWVAENPLADRLADALRDGGCAGCICNTVARAQELYSLLSGRSELGDVRLLHARFPHDTRQRLEVDAERAFGKEGPRPERAIVVSTQVIEQSLDLDFDLMVSDVAPVDLLLQRAGRLHRHSERDAERPKALRHPPLWLRRPEVDEDGVPDFGPAEIVYSRLVLLYSYLAVRDRSSIRTPGDVEELIEQVYGNLRPAPPSEAWARALDEAQKTFEEGRRKAEFKANVPLIGRPDTDANVAEQFCAELEEDDPSIADAFRAVTRLGPPSVEVVCLHRVDGRRCLDPTGDHEVDLGETPDADLARALLGNSLRIGHTGLVPHILDTQRPAGWRASPWLRFHWPLVFEGGACSIGRWVVRLDDELGLVIERNS